LVGLNHVLDGTSVRIGFPTFSTGLTNFHSCGFIEWLLLLSHSKNDCYLKMPERAMTVRLSQQLDDVQTELSRKLSEAERIGDCLMELGLRLQQEPWKWSIDWIEDAFPVPNSINPVEREIVAALDRNRIEWLLEDIRILKRRETELKRLAVA
jgi:transposase